MTEKSIQVVALVVSNDVLTFYKLDGSVYTITQGDPRGGAMSDEYLAQRRLGKEVVTLIIGEDDQTVAHLNSPKRSKLIRFFRAKIADVAKLFGSQTPDPDMTEASHEAAAAKVREVCARLYKSDAKTGPEVAQDDPLPIKMIHSEEPMAKDETIVAVTEDGIVPGVESMTDQFQAGEEGKAPAEGPDNLILRLTKMSAKRGHTASELMYFVKNIDLPILPDGSFLAYKRLKHIGKGVYVDPYSSKVHQRIGDIVQMDEKLVDPSRRTLCSQGLHIGTRHYMGGFHSNAEGSGTMLVLVQPEDAIAVPQRESSKARVCRYLILADLSNKAHDLVNQNKRMDDCKETMQIVAQIVAGARPPLLGVVNIGGAQGGGLTYHIGTQNLPTNISLDEAREKAQTKATAPTADVKEVRTIDDEANGNRVGLEPRKIRDKVHAVKPTDVRQKAAEPKEPVRVQVAAQLYGRMTDKHNTDADRLAAAKELKAHKQACKDSYEALKLPKQTADEIEEIITVASPAPAKAEPKKSASVPAPTSKAKAKVLKQPEPAKMAPQPAKPSGGTRQDRARAFWDDMKNTKLTGNHRKQAAEGLRDLKKAAKVSWDSLGLGKHNVEAELKKLLG